MHVVFLFNSGRFVRPELPDLRLPLLPARSTCKHRLQPPCRRWRGLPGAWHCHCGKNQIIGGIFGLLLSDGLMKAICWKCTSTFRGLFQHQKFSGEYHTWGKQFQCYFLRTRQEMEADSVHFALLLSSLWWKWNWSCQNQSPVKLHVFPSFLYLIQDNKCTTFHQILNRTIFRKLHVRTLQNNELAGIYVVVNLDNQSV